MSRHRLALLLLLALAFGLRVYRLGAQELRGDEAFGYFFIQGAVGQIVQETLALKEPHPVASYFLQRLWRGLTGESEAALRFVSVWFGVLAVALLYRLGRRLHLGAAQATVGAALLAVSPYTIWHSQDARMYSISLALTLASTLLALDVAERGRWRDGVAYVAVSWMALHVHYFAAFVLVAQSVFVLSRVLWSSHDLNLTLNRPFSRPSSFVLRLSSLVPWLVSQTALALAYAPWLWVAYPILTGYGGNGESPGLAAMVQRSLSIFVVGESVPIAWRTPVALLGAMGLAVGVARLVRGDARQRAAAWLLLLYLLVPLGATWASALSRPLFNERYLIAASPPFYLLLAGALGGGRGRTIVGGLLAGGLLLGMGLSLHGYHTDPAYSKDRGWRDQARALATLAAGLPAEQVRLAQNFPDPTLWYYYQGEIAHLVLPPAAHDVAGARATVAALEAEGVRRVVLPRHPNPAWDEGGVAEAALTGRFTQVAEREAGGHRLLVYARPEPSALEPIGAAFVNRLTLDAAALEPARDGAILPGGLVVVHLRWQGSGEALTGSEKLFLHLLDSNGAVAAQSDPPFTLTESGSIQSYAIPLPDTLPPGRYRLVAGLYDPALPNAPRLPLVEEGDFILLGNITVALNE